jgi:phosphate transport system protein
MPQNSSNQASAESSLTTPSEREIRALKARLVQEAAVAIGMLELALDALWRRDVEKAEIVLLRDQNVDKEEVLIEEFALRILALQQPVARDFRQVAFILKVNADIERVADHACAIAKVARKLASISPILADAWPTALTELGHRVPRICHALLKVLRNENADEAKAIIIGDKTIDNLHKQLFDETVILMRSQDDAHELGLLVYRLGRELERIGDLMTNIAEDVVYLVTGEIVRHEKKRIRAEAGLP